MHKRKYQIYYSIASLYSTPHALGLGVMSTLSEMRAVNGWMHIRGMHNYLAAATWTRQIIVLQVFLGKGYTTCRIFLRYYVLNGGVMVILLDACKN